MFYVKCWGRAHKNNSAGQHMLPCFVTLRRHTMQYPFPEPLKVAHPIGISFYHLDAVVAPFSISVAQSCPEYVQDLFHPVRICPCTFRKFPDISRIYCHEPVRETFLCLMHVFGTHDPIHLLQLFRTRLVLMHQHQLPGTLEILPPPFR